MAMTTTENDITNDMTPVEAATLLAKLAEGHHAAWLSTREAPWHSTEYQTRFQNAVEVDCVFRDIMRETVDNGMRRPGEPVEEFAERAGSEAWLAGVRTADLEPHASPAIQLADTEASLARASSSQYEVTYRPLSDARTPVVQAYARAFSGTAATQVRELRERDPLPEPDRTPGTRHPDPFLAGRGWQVNERGIYVRRAEPEPQIPPERELEAGLCQEDPAPVRSSMRDIRSAETGICHSNPTTKPGAATHRLSSADRVRRGWSAS